MKQNNFYDACTWTNDDVISLSKDLNNITLQLELSESDVLIENVSEDIFYKAAEMLIYLNFCPSKEIRYYFKLIHEDDLTIKQLLLGRNESLLIFNNFICKMQGNLKN